MLPDTILPRSENQEEDNDLWNLSSGNDEDISTEPQSELKPKTPVTRASGSVTYNGGGFVARRQTWNLLSNSSADITLASP